MTNVAFEDRFGNVLTGRWTNEKPVRQDKRSAAIAARVKAEVELHQERTQEQIEQWGEEWLTGQFVEGTQSQEMDFYRTPPGSPATPATISPANSTPNSPTTQKRPGAPSHSGMDGYSTPTGPPSPDNFAHGSPNTPATLSPGDFLPPTPKRQNAPLRSANTSPEKKRPKDSPHNRNLYLSPSKAPGKLTPPEFECVDIEDCPTTPQKSPPEEITEFSSLSTQSSLEAISSPTPTHPVVSLQQALDQGLVPQHSRLTILTEKVVAALAHAIRGVFTVAFKGLDTSQQHTLDVLCHSILRIFRPNSTVKQV